MNETSKGTVSQEIAWTQSQIRNNIVRELEELKKRVGISPSGIDVNLDVRRMVGGEMVISLADVRLTFTF